MKRKVFLIITWIIIISLFLMYGQGCRCASDDVRDAEANRLKDSLHSITGQDFDGWEYAELKAMHAEVTKQEYKDKKWTKEEVDILKEKILKEKEEIIAEEIIAEEEEEMKFAQEHEFYPYYKKAYNGEFTKLDFSVGGLTGSFTKTTSERDKDGNVKEVEETVNQKIGDRSMPPDVNSNGSSGVYLIEHIIGDEQVKDEYYLTFEVAYKENKPVIIDFAFEFRHTQHAWSESLFVSGANLPMGENSDLESMVFRVKGSDVSNYINKVSYEFNRRDRVENLVLNSWNCGSNSDIFISLFN